MITKTDFIAYLDAPRHLWAIKNGKLDKRQINAFLRHLFQQGYDVERLAEQYIRQHLIPQYKADDKDILFQPTKRDEDYEARTDILIKNSDTGKWDMYEIKSSTKVDKIHKYDVTFQALVFEKHYDLGDIYILHLDGEYKRQGEISLRKLFVCENANDYVSELREDVRQRRYETFLMSQCDKLEAVPECIRPKTCPCLELCHPDLPKYSIYDINRITGNEKKVRELVADGIFDVMDVPADFPLSEIQRLQVDVAQSGNTRIDTGAIKTDLAGLEYPLHFIDYESFNPAVPMYDGYKPFDQMPFQWSLHIQKEKWKELEHYEFIETKQIDPIPNFLSELRKHICDKGSIIVWNKGFEGKQNERMGEIHSQFEDFCKDMNCRLYDLMDIFRNQWYADPKFKGSYSIKNVLPVLVTDLSYQDMEIKEGADAMTKWDEMVYGDKLEDSQKEKIKDDLLKYCQMDTLAMVRIFEAIKDCLT